MMWAIALASAAVILSVVEEHFQARKHSKEQRETTMRVVDAIETMAVANTELAKIIRIYDRAVLDNLSKLTDDDLRKIGEN